jgi:hypothetical protein
MSRKMYANKIDGTQNEIVKQLRLIPGVTVELDHNDILCGYKGITFWYEIKNPETALDKQGRIYADEIKKSQREILRTFTGHYKIVSSFDEIWEDIQNTIKRLKI